MESLIARAESLLARLEGVLPAPLPATDWSAHAFRWRRPQGRGFLQAVKHPHRIHLADLQDIGPQKKQLVANTRQFLQGLPCNNVLLTGARGTGKSSLFKALLTDFADQGLRLVEVDQSSHKTLGRHEGSGNYRARRVGSGQCRSNRLDLRFDAWIYLDHRGYCSAAQRGMSTTANRPAARR